MNNQEQTKANGWTPEPRAGVRALLKIAGVIFAVVTVTAIVAGLVTLAVNA